MSLSRKLAGLLFALALGLGGLTATAGPATARASSVTNLAHLNFLLEEVSPPAVPGHSTYRLATDPQLVAPWTYADARPGGTFERIGGGTYDAATGHYSQGAFNTDDIARAAVVYLRHWRLAGSSDSRAKAYDLLRTVGYLQTTSGPNAGRSVLWMQSDGQLNPSAIPVELPDPSDSGPSYWQARTLWAYGEGYAGFRRSDPAFASFLRDRLRLSVRALNRDVLTKYGRYEVADGKRVPVWLINNGADATAEAVLGLSAYVQANPRDELVRTALTKFARGIAAMAVDRPGTWPYGAVLPWTESRSDWHAWASQMSAALARSSAALHRPVLLRPAVTEAVRFDPTLLTAGGADNGWLPAPVERVQIAYGVDSRVQSLLAVGDVGRRRVAADLAGLEAAWFFGANRAGAAMYDPATGVTYDGLEADGRINRNSGAESTIHGLLTMLALDAHPAVRTRAVGLTSVDRRDGLRLIEAEDATTTTGTTVRPASAWTGESSWSGGAYLALDPGETASFDVGTLGQRTVIEPVAWQDEFGQARTRWQQGSRVLGTQRHRVGAQGVTAVPGALLPQRLPRLAQPGAGAVQVQARRDSVRLDALLLRPVVSSMRLSGPAGTTDLLHSASYQPEAVTVDSGRARGQLRVYDRRGRLTHQQIVIGSARIRIPAGGVAVLVR